MVVKKLAISVFIAILLFQCLSQAAFGWGFFTHPQINKDALQLPCNEPPYYPEDILGPIPEPFEMPNVFSYAGNSPDIISVSVVSKLVPRGKFDYAHNDLNFGFLMRR